MSNSESFIEEVTEEVRRDRLFRLFRRYGWIAAVLIVILVGGAAVNEWRKATRQAAAEATGDAILAALETEDPAARAAALAEVPAEGPVAQVLAMITASESLAAGERDTAVERLRDLENNDDLSPVYRDLVALKRVIAEGSDAPSDERRATLDRLATPGAAFRLLAEEQLALLDLETGDNVGAIARLNAIIQDTEVTPGLRRRASQLIVALGGSLEGL